MSVNCGKCGQERDKYANCPRCNRERVYQWRRDHPYRWNAIQRESRRKRQETPEPHICQVCKTPIKGRNRSALYCSNACNCAAKLARRKRRHAG